jgi:hypothetical protein
LKMCELSCNSANKSSAANPALHRTPKSGRRRIADNIGLSKACRLFAELKPYVTWINGIWLKHYENGRSCSSRLSVSLYALIWSVLSARYWMTLTFSIVTMPLWIIPSSKGRNRSSLSWLSTISMTMGKSYESLSIFAVRRMLRLPKLMTPLRTVAPARPDARAFMTIASYSGRSFKLHTCLRRES